MNNLCLLRQRFYTDRIPKIKAAQWYFVCNLWYLIVREACYPLQASTSTPWYSPSRYTAATSVPRITRGPYKFSSYTQAARQ